MSLFQIFLKIDIFEHPPGGNSRIERHKGMQAKHTDAIDFFVEDLKMLKQGSLINDSVFKINHIHR
jgi:hypothetical protein